jgi:phycocyanobilin:ferredoxin oxidoreductase
VFGLFFETRPQQQTCKITQQHCCIATPPTTTLTLQQDNGWDYLDSLDPDRTLDGWSHADAAEPAPGEDGYPRLQVENRVYCSRAFRKLHLEVAVRQDGLQVLHVVFYPRYDYDLPIFALDVVIANGVATLAVADACPLSRDLSLPRHYLATLRELQEAHLADEPATNRTVPEWGRSIFSPLAVCMRPSGDEALLGFVKYAVAAARAHLMYASLLSPVDARTKAGARRLADLAAGHERFVTNQLSNRKTARVLEVAFGVERSDAYMRGLMFDYDPTDSPPYFDGSLSRLYRHFDRAPEPWADGKQLLAIRRGIDADKARVFLDR